MHRFGGLLCVALWLWGVTGIAQADALRRASQAVHGDASDKRQDRVRSESGSRRVERREVSDRRERRDSSDRRHARHGRRHHQGWHTHGDEYDDADGLDRAVGMAALQVLFFPFTLPRAVVADMNPQGYTVPIYPYADSLAYTVTEDPELAERHKLLRVHMRLGATARSVNLMSGTFAAQADFTLPLALHVGYRVLGEADAGQRTFAGLGTAGGLYRIAESRHLRFHTGLEYLQWLDGRGIGHGMGFVYGFDAFPGRPISFGSRVGIGALGREQAYALQWRTYLGVLISRYELQLAYDHLDIGGVQLGGLQLSMQVHL